MYSQFMMHGQKNIKLNFVTFGEFVKVNLPENVSTVKANYLQICNYSVYTVI